MLPVEVEVIASTPPHVLGLWLGVSECMLPVEVGVKASTPPHVLGLWLGVSECMLPVEVEVKASTRLRTVVGGKRVHAPCRGRGESLHTS